MLERATDADIAEVRRRLDAFTAPSFDRGIVEKLIARLEAVGGEPAGYLVRGFDGGPFYAPDRAQYDRQGHAVVPIYTAPQAPAVQVKGLRWPPECPRGQRVHGRGVPFDGAEYCIAHYGGSHGDDTVYRWSAPKGKWSEPFDSYNAAKAAAFADYEQRIRSALEAETGGGETPPSGKWEIDNSTGTPILVYDKCSVIESEQAYYLLGLIQRAATTTDERAVEALVEKYAPAYWTHDMAAFPRDWIRQHFRELANEVAALAQGESR